MSDTGVEPTPKKEPERNDEESDEESEIKSRDGVLPPRGSRGAIHEGPPE
jgi:hypothetical protein